MEDLEPFLFYEEDLADFFLSVLSHLRLLEKSFKS